MNHVYRLVWSHRRNGWIAVSELARGRKKGGGRKLTLAALSLAAAVAQAGPGGGQVVSGSGQISSSGNTTTITQSSQNLSLNWQSFNIAPQETVSFVQPSASAVAVNHILGTNGTQILGHLNANGQVYLINPNGILFGQGSVVNVGGLVASTLNPNDAAPGGASRSFSGSGTGNVTNEGTINAAPGGYVVLLGNRVSNTGTIVAQMGSVGLGAGSAVTLTFASDKLVSVQVDRSTLNNLAANGGIIQADGGRVIMTAGARDTLLASAVNNTGVIEAHTVEDHEGTITLLGGMTAGQVNVGGTLDASAPNGGDGGAIETSAAHVSVANNARITTAAPNGLVGSWLVDPQDFTVAASGGDITGSTLSGELSTTNIELKSSTGGTAGSGNVNVNDAVTWSANTALTLTASNNVNVNASITATGATAGLVVNPNTANGTETASGTGVFALNNGSSITLSGSNPSLSIAGQAYTVINSLGTQNSTTGADLQGMNRNLSGHYALGSDIDATATASWNNGAGFTPIGSYSTAFTGTFDGLGHSIGNLTINQPGAREVGLFANVGTTGVVQNVGLAGGAVTGNMSTGALVGANAGTVKNSYATTPVTGSYYVGGLVGLNYGTIKNSYATGAVSNSSYHTGGLVGANGTYTNNSAANISNSYATGAVTSTAADVGGLVGSGYGSIANSYATGSAASTGSNRWPGRRTHRRPGQGRSATATQRVSCPALTISAGWWGQVYSIGANVGSVTNSFWNVTTTGQAASHGGGTGLTTSQMQVASNFSGFNFTTTPGAPGNNWVMVDLDGALNGGGTGATYPMLASEYATTITNAHQLQLMIMALSANYSLGADIDAGATARANDVWAVSPGTIGFVPVGSSSTPFTGTFNGLGHTISNLSTGSLSSNDVGLFGNVGTTGVITNVGLVAAHVTGNDIVGALAGANYGTISNSYSTGSVSGGYVIGGLVGSNGYGGRPGTISNSHSTASVSGQYGTVGGLVGQSYGTIANSYATGSVSNSNYSSGGLVGRALSGTVSNSYATGGVSASGYYGRRAGGLVGANYGADITNSFATGAVSGNHAIGGLVGVDFSGTTSNVYATGAVSVSNGQGGGLIGVNFTTVDKTYATGSVTGSGGQLGGLIGASYGSNPITNSFWNAQTSGQSTSSGGLPLTTAQMLQQSSFSGWDFAGTWAIYAGYTNPLLRTFMTPLTVTASDASKTYDGSGYSGGNGVGYSVTPSGGNLLGSPTYGGSSQGAVNAGSYAITPQGLYSNQLGYLITYTDGTLTVNRAALTVTGTNVANKVYDGTMAASLAGGMLSGIVGSDVLTLTQAGAFVSPNAGSGVAVTAADSLSGGSAGNYTLLQPTGLTANITQATLTYTALPATVVSGKTPSGLSGTVSGFVAGDTLANSTAGDLGWTTSATGSSPAGSYAIDGGGLTAANYMFIQSGGNVTALTVTAAPTTPTAPATPTAPTAPATPIAPITPIASITSPAVAGLESIILPSSVSSPTLVLGALQTGTSPAAPAPGGDGPALVPGGSTIVSNGDSSAGAPVNSAPDGSGNPTVIDATIDLNGKGKLVIENQGVKLPGTAASIR